jgi:PAS domain S-box-containing protein
MANRTAKRLQKRPKKRLAAKARRVASVAESRAPVVGDIAPRVKLKISALQGEVGLVLVREAELRAMLANCAELMVRNLDAALVRIWTASADGKMLELQASAGMYTHLDGPHSRIRMGEYKIGLIAQERVPRLTNSTAGDALVHDRGWAKQEKLVGFAGHPLLVDDELVGVMALFSRNALPREILNVLAAVANAIALGINRKRGEESLRESEALLRGAFSQTYSFMAMLTPEGKITDVNRAVQEAVGLSSEEIVGKYFWELWGHNLEEEAVRLKAMVTKAAAGESARAECQYIGTDGTLRAADRTLSPVKDEAGNIMLLIATGKDVTEQKEMRDELERKVVERTRELNEKNTEIAQQASRLRDLSTRLLKVQDDERRRIARELHDSAGQELAALSMNFYVIRGKPGSLTPAQERAVNESCELLGILTEEIRTLSYLLHPPLLDETGLSSALQWYVDGFAQRSKIAVNLEIAKDFGRLPTEIETTLFRVVQESLTNVHRHSGSATAEIQVRRLEGEVRLDVLDTGVGMPLRKRANGDDAKAGVGILGMSERVRQLGGSFEISAGQPGTRITASLPVRSQAE